LQNILGDRRHASIPAQRRPSAERADGVQSTIGTQTVHKVPSVTRWNLIGAGAIVLCLCACLGIASSLLSNLRLSTLPSSATIRELPTIATCSVAKCGCITKGNLRNGSILYVELSGKDMTSVSGFIRDPTGKLSSLSFIPLASNRKGQACYTARYPLDQSSKPGSYSVQITARDSAQAQASLSRGFIVKR
jgi:hypothetical protein